MRFENRSYGLNMKYINFEVLVNKLLSGIYQGKLEDIRITAAALYSIKPLKVAAKT
jgi:hypothetical protein